MARARFAVSALVAALCAWGAAAEAPRFAGGHAPGAAQHAGGPAAPHAQSSRQVGVSEKQLDGHVDDVVWASRDGAVILVLTNRKTLYRSSDGGKTWANQMEALKALHSSHAAAGGGHPLPPVGGIASVVKTEHAMVFVGDGGPHFISTDAGKTYTPIWHAGGEKLGEFKLHPARAGWLLASTLTRRCYDASTEGLCYKSLHISEDAGATWRQLHEYVTQYDWAAAMKTHASEWPEEAVFATVHRADARAGVHQIFGKWDNRVDFVVSADKFATAPRVLVPRGNRFLFTERYVSVAQVAEHDAHVTLQLSADGCHRFHPAELEYPMTQHSYTILDTSNDAVFLHVNHAGEGARWGNVYLSNAMGTNFSLSLPYNRRDEHGKCDFERLQSMEGVFVANYYENAAEIEAWQRASAERMGQEGEDGHGGGGGDAPESVVRTVMTFDRGGSWEYLAAPEKDAHGERIVCVTAPADAAARGSNAAHCSLHLHGVTDVFGPFYSSPTAVGLLMATGNVGESLTFKEGLVNTFFSRDGGHEWYEVAKGSHIYEFGDHGGLIVMANDEREVTEVLYSWNEGLSWESLKFTQTPVLVDNIMIEPRGASERFVLYGTRPEHVAAGESSEGARAGVIFALDFSQLHPRECEKADAAGTDASDFERWAPSATSKGDNCLLGRQVDYVRRKRDRQCFNPESIEIRHFIRNCECTEHDWECDRGYRRVPRDSGPCVRDPEVPITSEHLVPGYCRPGLHYHVSNGYRLVAGDSCTGGVQHELTPMPCPGSAWHHSVSHHGWFVLATLITLCIALAAISYVNRPFAPGAGRKGAAGAGAAGAGAGAAGGGLVGRLTGALPAVVAKPVAAVLGGALALVAGAAALAYALVAAVGGRAAALVRRGGAGGAGATRRPPSGGAWSSRGFGIGGGGGGSSGGGGAAGAKFVGVAYNSLSAAGGGAGGAGGGGDDDDAGGASTAIEGDEADGAGGDARGAKRGGRGGGGGDDEDGDFGLGADDDDEGEANMLSAAAIHKTVRGAGAGAGAGADGEADLLGIASGGGGATPGRGAGAGARSNVPVLRPPRSHDSPSSALKRSS